MLFPTPQFMFVFLPVVATLYFILSLAANGRLQLLWIVIASLTFYAFWSVPFAGLMLCSVAVNYAVASRIGALRRSRIWLACGILFNMLLLGYFKYSNFLIETLSQVTSIDGIVTNVILPLGISFYTIQQIGYLFDVHNGKRAQRDLLLYTAYVTFFPQLVAGPIVRAGALMPQLNPARLVNVAKKIKILAPLGLAWLAMGLVKKLVLADSIAPYVDKLYAAAAAGYITPFEAWLAPFSYGVQLYFDFSGYSDMAIGLGLILGFRLPDNFESPYRARSIQDFWRRWHMTLSFFLRDRLYISLGGNRYGVSRQIIALIATMTIGGLWHGAGWTFILWGIIHGVMLCLHLGARLAGLRQMPLIIGWLMTLFSVMLAWVLFRSESLEVALTIYSNMLAIPTLINTLQSVGAETWKVAALTTALLAISVILPEPKWLLRGHWPVLQALVGQRYLRFQPTIGWTIVITAAFAMSFWRMQNYSPFLYFQF